MAGSTPRLPEQFRNPSEHGIDDFVVSELVADTPGSHSPFGDLLFPLMHDQLTYRHPGPADRPNLADGR